MARIGTHNSSITLEVKLGQLLIGHIYFIPPDESLFVFTDEYVEHLFKRATLSQSFRTATGIRRQSARYRMQLPPFFSNLLPEGHLRTYLSEKLGVHPKREFFLIAELGDDLPGAVVVSTSSPFSVPPFEVMAANTAAADDLAFRFSLAGIQLKFSAIKEAAGGLTIPAHGVGGDWILKLPGGVHQNIGENEYSMLEIARAIGITVPQTRLIETAHIRGLPDDIPFAALEGKTFAIKRFDRVSNGGRIHIEDFAQIFDLYPSEKYKKISYKNIASFIWVEAGQDDLLEFIRRLVFNILIGNADMHAKNWSIIYPDGTKPRLAPAYDFVSTVAYHPDRTLGLSIAQEKRMEIISRAHFERFTDKAQLPKHLVLNTVAETVERFIDVWDSKIQHLPLIESHVRRIESHFKSLALLKTRRHQN